jgi:hypothetical protein
VEAGYLFSEQFKLGAGLYLLLALAVRLFAWYQSQYFLKNYNSLGRSLVYVAHSTDKFNTSGLGLAD